VHDNHEHAVSDVATTVADVATARAWLQVRDDSKTLINWPIAEWMRVAGWRSVTHRQRHTTVQKQLCQIPDVFNPVRFRFHHEKLWGGAQSLWTVVVLAAGRGTRPLERACVCFEDAFIYFGARDS
jgi:hypothetical protein